MAVEPVCGELASNQKVFQIGGTSHSNAILGQRFEVTYAVMVSNFSAALVPGASNVVKAELYDDSNGTPGSALLGGSLIIPSSGGGMTTFSVNNSGSGQLYLSQGLYWLVLAANASSTLSWNYLNQTASPNVSMPIALHGSGNKVNAQSTWILRTTAFRFNVSGCDLTGIPSATPTCFGFGLANAIATANPSPHPDADTNTDIYAHPDALHHTPSSLAVAFELSTGHFLGGECKHQLRLYSRLRRQHVRTLSRSKDHSEEVVFVSSQFTGLVLGNNSLPAASLTGFRRTVSEDSGSATTYLYAAEVDEATRLEQAFTFHAANASGEFAGSTFEIGAGSVKWSVNITRTNASSYAHGVTLKYRLTGLLGSNVNASYGSQSSAVVRRARNTPQAGMTTYFLAFAPDPTDQHNLAGCAVEVFDAALIDDADTPVPIEHDVVQVESQAEFELVLSFPAFQHSLVYDPSLSLGVLLGGGGRDEQDGSSSDSDNLGMIVAVAVVIPVAVVVVLAVIVVGTALIIRRKKLARAKFRKSALVSQTV